MNRLIDILDKNVSKAIVKNSCAEQAYDDIIWNLLSNNIQKLLQKIKLYINFDHDISPPCSFTEKLCK